VDVKVIKHAGTHKHIYTVHGDVLEGGRRPPKRFFRLGGRIMVAPTQEPPKKIINKIKEINKF